MVPNSAHVLLPQTYEYLNLQGRGDFADVMKVRILRWGDYCRFPGEPECHHKGPFKRIKVKGDVTIEAKGT